MRLRNIIAAVVVVIAVFAVLVSQRTFEPVIGFPGGRLSGTEQQKPQDWSVATDIGTIQLETRPDDPYSVNLWGVGIGPDFYVATRPEGTGWSENIIADPRVRLRIGNDVFSLVATGVGDSAERKRVSDAYVAKYDANLEENIGDEGLIYRLDAR